MSEISAATGKALALSMLKGVGPAALRKVAQVPDFVEKSIEELAIEVPPIGRAIAHDGAWSKALVDAEQQLELADPLGVRILSRFDDEYPPLVRASKDDPFLLWVQGILPPLPAKSVAIIGTRKPTPHGEVIAKRITRFFTDQDWTVVSGLAIGCDVIAHEETLAAGGHTVAVLAHGHHTVAPKQHQRLAHKILDQGGALVSQYPVGRDAIPQQFVQRDKTQAAIASGVVMVQSNLGGGSLHASRAAIAYGRWLAIPYPTDADQASGAPQVGANLVLSEGSLSERQELLSQPGSDLQGVIILRGKADYEKCLPAPVAITEPMDVQGRMF